MELTDKQARQVYAIVKNYGEIKTLKGEPFTGQTILFEDYKQYKNGNVRFSITIVNTDEVRSIWYSQLIQSYFSENLACQYFPKIQFIDKEIVPINNIEKESFISKVIGHAFFVSQQEDALYTYDRKAKQWPFFEDYEEAINYMQEKIEENKIPSVAMLLRFAQCYNLTEIKFKFDRELLLE